MQNLCIAASTFFALPIPTFSLCIQLFIHIIHIKYIITKNRVKSYRAIYKRSKNTLIHSRCQRPPSILPLRALFIRIPLKTKPFIHLLATVLFVVCVFARGLGALTFKCSCVRIRWVAYLLFITTTAKSALAFGSGFWIVWYDRLLCKSNRLSVRTGNRNRLIAFICKLFRDLPPAFVYAVGITICLISFNSDIDGKL